MFDLFWILELGHRLGLKAENIKLIDFFFFFLNMAKRLRVGPNSASFEF